MSALAALSRHMGVPEDKLQYVSVLLLSFPLSLLLTLLPLATPAQVQIRHAFALLSGFAICVWAVGSVGMLHSFLSAIGAYIICATVKGINAPILVFLATIVHLSAW
jgi:hypothetical protein